MTKHSPNTGEKCKCRNTKSPIATIRFWNANCPIHTESEVIRTKPSKQENPHINHGKWWITPNGKCACECGEYASDWKPQPPKSSNNKLKKKLK